MNSQTQRIKLEIIPIDIDKANVYGVQASREATRINLNETIKAALELKMYLGVDWKYMPGTFNDDFRNYLSGWNDSDDIYKKSKDDHELLYLNLDLQDNGCTRRCSHCFTMAGQIDIDRGRAKSSECGPKKRKAISKDRLIEQIAKAKDKLGLKAVRILGRGEPTESSYLLEFTEIMNDLGLQTVIFTRGHVMGNDPHTEIVFGKFGIKKGIQLVERLYELNASIVLGYSALNDIIHNGMIGIENHSNYCRKGLKHFIDAGFINSNPTRLAIEAPIAKLNMNEMPVSYILFQCLGISPIYNTYMVTGRADQSYFDSNTPSLQERLLLHSEIIYYMESLGIKGGIGPYLGTKECHDVSNGLYIPSSGDIRPCTGYESSESIKGDLNIEDIDIIWERSKIKGLQSLCPPKINHGFSLNYEDLLNECLDKNRTKFKSRYDEIIMGLGFS